MADGDTLWEIQVRMGGHPDGWCHIGLRIRDRREARRLLVLTRKNRPGTDVRAVRITTTPMSW